MKRNQKKKEESGGSEINSSQSDSSPIPIESEPYVPWINEFSAVPMIANEM